MTRPVRLILVVTGIITAMPGVAWAQPAGWYLRPTLSVGEQYQSNIFGVAERTTSDFITLFTPILEGGYRSVPLTVLGSYSITGQVYAENSELNNLGENQSGRLLFSYLPDPRWTLNLVGRFERTNNPSRLLQTPSPAPTGGPQPPGTTAPTSTGAAGIPTQFVPTVDFGQVETTYITVNPFVSYQLNPRTTATAGYDYTRSESDDAITTEQAAHVSLARQLTVRDQGSLNYDIHLIEGTGGQGEGDTQTSHVITLEWVRQLTPLWTLTLGAGPSFNEGGVTAAIRAGIDYRLKTVSASLFYERTQGVVVGLTGGADVDLVTANVGWAPCLRCAVGLFGSVGNYVPLDSSEGLGDLVYTAGASFSYGINEWMSVRASYSFYYQNPIEENVGSITDHIVSVNLDFSYLFRIH